MAKAKSQFVCQSCGTVYSRWQGRCEGCGEWNTIVEEIVDSGVGAGPKSAVAGGRPTELVPLAGETESAARIVTGLAELDRVTGGGFVMGSAVLVGGDPGIGKSTLLLQAAAALASRGKRVVYVSGEEAVAQIRLRAQRLGLGDREVLLAAETSVEIILATLQQGPAPDLVIIDSIQTLWTDRVESAPGTVTQVRTSAQALTRFAKKSGAAVVLVGHVTKDGQIAGPRVLEHMVDAVLYFEGDASHTFRILRGVKNRYGATDEIGVFEMTTLGLQEVSIPSALFLDQRDKGAAGSAVFAGMEGTRPVLVEIQALVAPSPLGTPRRAVVGWDSARLSMILAVLESRCGVRIGANDIYLNVAGGLKVNEPRPPISRYCRCGADFLAHRRATAADQRLFRRNLAYRRGGVRPVVHAALRLREAQKLGFSTATTGRLGAGDKASGLAVSELSSLAELVSRVAANARPRATDD